MSRRLMAGWLLIKSDNAAKDAFKLEDEAADIVNGVNERPLAGDFFWLADKSG